MELVQYHKRDSSYGLRGRALEWSEQSGRAILSVQSGVTDISTLSIKNLGRHSLVWHSGEDVVLGLRAYLLACLQTFQRRHDSRCIMRRRAQDLGAHSIA